MVSQVAAYRTSGGIADNGANPKCQLPQARHHDTISTLAHIEIACPELVSGQAIAVHRSMRKAQRLIHRSSTKKKSLASLISERKRTWKLLVSV